MGKRVEKKGERVVLAPFKRLLFFLQINAQLKAKMNRSHIPIGVLLRGEDGKVTCLRLFLGLSTLINACLQEKLTAGSYRVNSSSLNFLSFKCLFTVFGKTAKNTLGALLVLIHVKYVTAQFLNSLFPPAIKQHSSFHRHHITNVTKV